MKKIITFLFTIFLITGCSTEVSKEEYPKMGYRHYSVSRQDDGNIMTEIKTDIPNGFRCRDITKEAVFSPDNYRAEFTGAFLKEDIDGFKTLKINTSHITYYTLENRKFKDIYLLELGYFCVDGRYALNDHFDKYIDPNNE